MDRTGCHQLVNPTMSATCRSTGRGGCVAAWSCFTTLMNPPPRPRLVGIAVAPPPPPPPLSTLPTPAVTLFFSSPHALLAPPPFAPPPSPPPPPPPNDAFAFLGGADVDVVVVFLPLADAVEVDDDAADDAREVEVLAVGLLLRAARPTAAVAAAAAATFTFRSCDGGLPDTALDLLPLFFSCFLVNFVAEASEVPSPSPPPPPASATSTEVVAIT
jgi:hypothetical protein